MRTNTKQSSIIAVVVAVAALAGGYMLWQSRSAAPLPPPAGSAPVADRSFSPPSSVTVMHSRANGIETYEGSVLVPLTCQKLSAGTLAGAGEPVPLTIVLTVLKLEGQPCLQIPAAQAMQSFTLAFGVPAGRHVTLAAVIINGVRAPFVVQEK